MRKFLSLVLALVMTMSLVTVSAGAAFKDEADIEYIEAVDVISALGIVSGSNDKYMPEGNLTRGAAAKIICNLLLGVGVADDLDASATPFSDVPAGSTFGKYIAYVAKEGIVGGYGDGTFRPSNNVTGSQFLKMLLGALGYDAVAEGMGGTDYATKASVLASKRGLTDGIEEFNGKAVLTRDEAAQLIFNTLKANTVSYDTKSTIEINGIVISNNSVAKVNNGQNDTEEIFFYEANFKTLSCEEPEADEEDAFGRPAHSWYYKNELIGTYVDEADVVYYGAFTGKDLYKDLGKVTLETEDGDIAKDSDDDFGSATGMVTYVYYTADDVETEDNEEALDLYQIEYVVDVVDEVFEVEYDKYGDVKTEAYVTLDSGKEFETTAFAADEVVLVALDGGEVIDMVKAESITGEITAIKAGEFRIGGKYYAEQTDVDGLAIGAKGTYYLNQDGAIVKFVGESNKTDKYGYIYNVKALDDTTSDDGITLDTEAVTVYMVLADGSKASFKVTDEDSLALIPADFEAGVDGMLVAYAVKDGELTIKTGADVNDTVAAAAVTNVAINKAAAKVNGMYINSKTEFIFIDLEEDDGALTGKVKATTATGYKSVKVAEGDAVWTVSNEDGEVIYAFVADTQRALEDETTYYAVLADVEAVETENADEEAEYTYDVLVDGKATTLTFKAALDLELGAVLTYTMEGEYAVYGAELTADKTVDYANSDYVVFAGDETLYNQDDAKVYLVAVDAEEETVKVTSSKLVASDEDYTVTAKVAKVDSDDETVLELVFMWKTEVPEAE